jgi:L-malate glycosyltransferase
MKKILFLIARYEFGGAERQLTYILSKLDRTKFKVYLGFLYDDHRNDTPLHLMPNTTKVTFNKKGSFDLGVYFRIARFIRDNKIEIVQSLLGNHHAYIPALLTPVIPVGGVRSTFDSEFSFWQKINRFWIAGWIAKKKRFLLVSNSRQGKDIYVSHGFPADSIHVIENGIDYQRFMKGNGKKIRAEFGIEGKFVIGNIGRLSEEKNQEGLLHIFHELDLKNKNLVLLIIGEGPLRDHLTQVAEDLNISKRVIFTGNRTDIPDLLNAMDLFFLPSRSEAWPNVLGEAMAAGRATISYRTGDVEYIIKNTINGIMTEQNKELFIRAAIALIKDQDKRMTLGRNAEKTIRVEFSVDRMVKRYEQLYEALA